MKEFFMYFLREFNLANIFPISVKDIYIFSRVRYRKKEYKS